MKFLNHGRGFRNHLSTSHNRRKFIEKTLTTGVGVVASSGILKHFGLTAYGQQISYDVVVVGSGAGGMTAALAAAKRGLSVLLVEKAETFGGSTARSGGGIWIRNNPVNKALGIQDSLSDAEEYLMQVAGNGSTREKQRAFLEQGPKMISFVIENTPLEFRWMEGYADYYPNFQGAKPNGASIEPQVLDGRVLGTELKNLNPPYIPTPAGVVIYGADYKWLCLVRVTLQGAKTAARAVSRYIESKLRFRKPLTMGQALAAGLRAGLMQANIPVWLNTPMLDLSVNDEGRVDGVVVKKDGINTLLQAKYGVIIASGGFERNLEMRRKYQQQPIGVDWTLGAKENTGDGILAGQRVGADLELMDDAWWGPVVPLVPDQPYFCLSERSLPGSILVNSDAKRFVNESSPYHDVVNAMYAQPRVGQDLPIWLIADQNYRSRYLFKDVLPGLPFPEEWSTNGAVYSAPTLKALAELIEIPAETLGETVETFNAYALSGSDLDFSRGENAFDRYYSDPSVGPNPSLAQLKQGPFYAFRMMPGDLGTKGGLRTDDRSRVLRENGSVIPGLYATGNASSPVMGRSYAGPGSTLGPAMTFGYIAAQDIAHSRSSP